MENRFYVDYLLYRFIHGSVMYVDGRPFDDEVL